MTPENIEMLVQLRDFVIGHHDRLDGSRDHTIAVVKQKDVAQIYESIIRSIEDLIKDHVEIR